MLFCLRADESPSIQQLSQFETEHVLDVNKADLYPFDTFSVLSTFTAMTPSNETTSIRRIFSVDEAMAFTAEISDLDSYRTGADGSKIPARDFDMKIRRPTDVKIITIILFSLCWMLSHFTIGQVILCRRTKEAKAVIRHLFFAITILFIIPQIRNSMPDAPDFDGVSFLPFLFSFLISYFRRFFDW